jgi:hypothetical protein
VGRAGRVQGFRGLGVGLGGPFRTARARTGILVSGFWILNSAFALASWHGIYDDAPIAVHITPSKRVYQVGDSFRLSITATNTSDRALLIKRDWNEQLVFYHIPPHAPSPQPLAPSSQVEWPGKVLVATWMDSTDVVRVEPNQSYTVNRYVRTWIPEDVSTFQFRLKLVGIKDYGRKFDMWQGNAWSNPITLSVRPKR